MRNLFFLLLVLPLTSCGKSELNWLILSPNNIEGLTNLKFLLSGLTTTIFISVVSIIISIFLGLVVAIPSLAKNKLLTYLNIGYVEIVRAIPLLVLILWIYYGLPIMTGISFSPFVSGIIALSISESAFQAEIFRAGINSIKKSQWEAGSSLGFSFFKKLRLIILPQAIKNILPAIGNQFVYVLKMSSLVSIIGIGDLTRKANELVVTTYRPLEIYTFLIIAIFITQNFFGLWLMRQQHNIGVKCWLIFNVAFSISLTLLFIFELYLLVFWKPVFVFLLKYLLIFFHQSDRLLA